MKKVFVIIFIVLCIVGGVFGYLYFNGLSGQHVYETPLEGEIKIACVGDSVTYGHGVSGWISNNYPKQLDTLLGEGYCVNNYGHSGATVQGTGDQPYITYGEFPQSLQFDADIIIFMMGSNDSKPENWRGEEAFRQQYLQRLSEYKADNSDVRIILATPPVAYYPEGATEGLTNYDIDPAIVAEIADIVRDIAATEGYELVDVYALTEGHREYFLTDNVHPNKDGANFLAKTFYDYLILTEKVNVKLYHLDGENWSSSKKDLFIGTKWEPGLKKIVYFKVSNQGKSAVEYELSIAPNGDTSKLAEVIDVYCIDGSAEISSYKDLSNYTPIGTLEDIINNKIKIGTLQTNESHTFTIVLKMSEMAGNEYQGVPQGDGYSIELLYSPIDSDDK